MLPPGSGMAERHWRVEGACAAGASHFSVSETRLRPCDAPHPCGGDDNAPATRASVLPPNAWVSARPPGGLRDVAPPPSAMGPGPPGRSTRCGHAAATGSRPLALLNVARAQAPKAAGRGERLPHRRGQPCGPRRPATAPRPRHGWGVCGPGCAGRPHRPARHPGRSSSPLASRDAPPVGWAPARAPGVGGPRRAGPPASVATCPRLAPAPRRHRRGSGAAERGGAWPPGHPGRLRDTRVWRRARMATARGRPPGCAGGRSGGTRGHGSSGRAVRDGVRVGAGLGKVSRKIGSYPCLPDVSALHTFRIASKLACCARCRALWLPKWPSSTR
jgi:hypothetical protein